MLINAFVFVLKALWKWNKNHAKRSKGTSAQAPEIRTTLSFNLLPGCWNEGKANGFCRTTWGGWGWRLDWTHISKRKWQPFSCTSNLVKRQSPVAVFFRYFAESLSFTDCSVVNKQVYRPQSFDNLLCRPPVRNVAQHNVHGLCLKNKVVLKQDSFLRLADL